MSPVSTLRNEGTIRSASPLRSEITSQNDGTSNRGVSPARGVGNIAAGGNAFAQQQQAHQAALAALQGHASQPAPQEQQLRGKASKERHRLSLQTHVPAPPPVPEEDEEEMEVISMSPAVREPVMSFRKSRSSLALSALAGPGASSSQINLSGMNLSSDPSKRNTYFGQTIDSHDLVATGLENAFDRL